MKSTTHFNKNKKGIECLNCGQPLRSDDNFCADCGQVNDERPLSISDYFSGFFSNFFSFDSKLYKTIIPLLFKPGKVSKEYIEGKRKKYTNPFQLYLHTTIVFFLLNGLISTIKNLTDINQEVEDVVIVNDTIKTTDALLIKKDSLELDFNQSIDSIQNSFISNGLAEVNSSKFVTFFTYINKNKRVSPRKALDSLGYPKSMSNVFWYQRTQDIHKLINEKSFRKDYSNALISKISIALFFLLPLYTLFLSLLYIRYSYIYSEHLVVVFNIQTVLFILLIIGFLLDTLLDTNLFISLFILVFIFYIYKTLRNFYKQSRAKTILKFLILNFVYFTLAFFGFIAISFLAFIV